MTPLRIKFIGERAARGGAERTIYSCVSRIGRRYRLSDSAFQQYIKRVRRQLDA